MPNLQIPMPLKTLTAIASVLIVSLPVVEQKLPSQNVVTAPVVSQVVVAVTPGTVRVFSLPYVEPALSPRAIKTAVTSGNGAPGNVNVQSLPLGAPALPPQLLRTVAGGAAPVVTPTPAVVTVLTLPFAPPQLAPQTVVAVAGLPFVAPPIGAPPRTVVYGLALREPAPPPRAATLFDAIEDNAPYDGYITIYSLPDEIERPRLATFTRAPAAPPPVSVPINGTVTVYKLPYELAPPQPIVKPLLPVAVTPVVTRAGSVTLVKLPLHEYFMDYGKHDVIFVKPGLPPAGLLETVKSFKVTTGIVGSLVVVPHGLSVKPQIIIVTLSGRTDTVDSSGRAFTTPALGYRKSFGAAIQSPAQALTQFCVGTHSDDATTFTQTDDSVRNDCIACVMTPTDISPNTTFGRLAVQSIDGTNVTFVINETFDNNYTAQVEFIGGTDLTYLSLVAQKAPLVAGTQAIVAPGFKPDFILFFGGHLSSLPPAVENDSGMCIGAVDKNLNQWAMCAGTNDAGGGGVGGSGRARTYMRAGECITVPTSDMVGMDSRATLQSLDPLGYTLNWTKLTTVNRVFIALCVQGGNWSVGNFLSQTDTAPHQLVNGLAYKPIGAILVSAGKAESVIDTLDLDEDWSVGLLQASPVEPLVNMCQYAGELDRSVGTTTVSTAIGFSSSYIDLNNGGAVVAQAGVVSIQPDGFTWQHTVADASQKFIGYITFAPVAVPPFSVTTITVKPKGGGDYLNLQTALQTELAAHKNLISQNTILRFACYDGIDSIPVSIAGWHNSGGFGYMTDPAHYILIEAVVGHSGIPKFDGSVYALDLAVNGNGMLIQNEYVRFKQLLVRHTVDVSGGGIAAYFCGTTGMTAPTYWEFVNCIAYGVIRNGAIADGFKSPGATFDLPGVCATYINCVAFHYLSQDSVMSGFNTALGVNQNIRRYNCTTYDCNQGFQDHADVVDLNCVAVGCDNGWNTSTGPNAVSDYNFSTNGPPGTAGAYYPGTNQTGALDAKGPHSVNGLPVLMVDPLNDDIRPDGGDTSIVGTGTDLSFDPVRAFNFDIANNPRVAPWNKGAYQPNLPTVQRVVRAWVGGVTSAVAQVAIGLNLPEPNVTLKVSPIADLSSGVTTYGPVATNANKTAFFTVVPSGNVNYYQVWIGGSPVGAIRSFQGFPQAGVPQNFKFACGGCSDTGSNTNLYTAIKAQNPILMIEYGDLHYWNINTNDVALFRKALDTVALAPKRGSLFDSVPLAWVWDDHDFADDNSDGTNPARPASQATYRENVPSYALPSSSGAVYQSFVIGRCRFILTDLRSERDSKLNADSSTHTQMSLEQLTWFKAELTAAKLERQIVFWFSTVPWIAPAGDNNSDDWGGFTFERAAVADFIQQLDWPNIIIFCGDQHSAAIDDGTNDKYTTDGLGNSCPVFLPFPENQTTQVYGGTYTQGPLSHAQTRLMGFAGIVTVTDDGLNITVKLDVINELGVVMTFTVVRSFTCFTQISSFDPGFAKVSPFDPTFTRIGSTAVTYTKKSSVDPCA